MILFLREIELFINTKLFDKMKNSFSRIIVVSSGNQNYKINTYYDIDEVTKTKIYNNYNIFISQRGFGAYKSVLVKV